MTRMRVWGKTWTLALLPALGLAACSAREPLPVASPIHLYVFVDQSTSAASGQRPRWRQTADQAAKGLQSGDAVSVYALSDRTAEAAALFHRSTDVVPRGAGVSRTGREQERLAALRRDAVKAVEASLTDSNRANWTDVFAAWGRLKPDPNRRKVVALLLTDGVHSTRELDLERKRLRPTAFPDVLQQAAARYGWTNDTLTGVDVAFVLDSLDVGATTPVIDRRTLRSFYETLVASLGGRLVGFDTDFRLERRS